MRQDTIERLNKAKELIATGMKVEQACTEAKIASSQYYKNRGKKTKPVKVVDIIAKPVVIKDELLTMVRGTPAQLAAFMNGVK